MLIKSSLPNLTCPEDKTVWSWLFEGSNWQKIQEDSAGLVKGVTDTESGERITYLELKSHAARLSSALIRDHDLQPQDTVLFFSENNVWYPAALFALVRAGAIVAGSSPASTAEEMAYYLGTSHARFIMTVPASAPVALEAAHIAGIPQERIFLLHGQYADLVCVHDLIEAGAGSADVVPPFAVPVNETNRQLCGYLSFTSGTTGRPKACMISHHNVIAQCLQMAQVSSSDYDKALAILPLYHITGLLNLLHLPIFRNSETLMLPKFKMESMLKAIEKYRLTEVLMVPPLLIRMAKDPIVAQYNVSCIRRFVSGSAPIPGEVLQLLKTKFPNTGFRQGWGMTESCCSLTATDPAHYDYKYASTAGVILANTEIKFLDENGVEAEQGEILARGPQCTMGYLDAPEATGSTFLEDGWLRTGDVGTIDADGCMRITGRIKDLIKVKGVSVSPVELEDVLLKHPKVQDVGVLGVRDDYSGEVPHAYVLLRQEVQASRAIAEELLQFGRERVAPAKRVRSVSFVDDIPRGGNGKLLRRQLQAIVENSKPKL